MMRSPMGQFGQRFLNTLSCFRIDKVHFFLDSKPSRSKSSYDSYDLSSQFLKYALSCGLLVAENSSLLWWVDSENNLFLAAMALLHDCTTTFSTDWTLKGVGSLGGASGCSAGTLCKWDGCTMYSLKRYVRMNIQVRVTTARQEFIQYASTRQRQHNTANVYLWL